MRIFFEVFGALGVAASFFMLGYGAGGEDFECPEQVDCCSMTVNQINQMVGTEDMPGVLTALKREADLLSNRIVHLRNNVENNANARNVANALEQDRMRIAGHASMANNIFNAIRDTCSR